MLNHYEMHNVCSIPLYSLTYKINIAVDALPVEVGGIPVGRVITRPSQSMMSNICKCKITFQCWKWWRAC